MGLFRRSQSKSQSKQEAMPSTLNRHTSAGRHVESSIIQHQVQPQQQQQKQQQQQQKHSHGYDQFYYEAPPHSHETDTHTFERSDGGYSSQRQYGSVTHREDDRYVATNGATAAMMLSAFSPDDNGDFDDAGSYHSTSSNPGMSTMATSAAHASDAAYSKTMPSRYLHMAASQGRGPSRNERPPIDSYYSTTGDENLFRSQEENTQGAYGNQQHAQQYTQQPALTVSAASAYANNTITSPAAPAERSRAKTAQELGEEFFQKAVAFHEQGDLVSATAYFKRAADKNSPLGMLFYGLSLRHGWGCQPNENLAFVFLQKAGEQVVPHVRDMDPGAAGIAREELAMAIYELGQSYRHGWGVSRNKKTAAYYFEVAADLGDADAQADLAACYEKGDGVKRDMKRAAHYYRLAHKQGIEMFGTSWIFKKKYESD
ncbi:hypothetical protein H4217_001538 [Coemansia sp. RSA 1939]|nr:hypothetical protein H4217_001538 [Coemansia sp. RSA 1939]KAJ2614592.1 hypothetical protein EV177_001992 [Coemansia sp. RSA 1804]